MLPYVSVDLDLDQQLVHLSTAAHMAFYLYRVNSARSHFMPTQTFIDIMIMIKNVYYCVAKVKVDNPQGRFYPILLGTDRLETFFGLIRTAVGTDANVDPLQLGSCASGLTEVAAILAEHPEWDIGTRRLALPQITQQVGEITSMVDHITPKDWRGDTTVARVNLHTCWLLGCRQAAEHIPEAGLVFDQLSAEDSPNIDILSPLGTLLVHQRDGGEDLGEDDLEGVGPDLQDDSPLPSQPAGDVIGNLASTSYTHDGDLEDAMADEMPRNNVDSTIVIQGQKTSKAKALHLRMVHRSNRSSTDRLRRMQNVPCFDTTSSTNESIILSCDKADTMGPFLRVGDPIALLVRCETLVVLAVAQVNRLRIASHSDLDELAVPLLVDPTAKVDCQLLRLVLASVEDNPTQVHDWCWSMCMEATWENVDGQYIHSLNPSVSVLKPGKPTFLFESGFLVNLSCALFQDLWPEDYQRLPWVKRTEAFPYRTSGTLVGLNHLT